MKRLRHGPTTPLGQRRSNLAESQETTAKQLPVQPGQPRGPPERAREARVRVGVCVCVCACVYATW